jgi:uncharacterized protein YaiL (DUF2058 family)
MGNSLLDQLKKNGLVDKNKALKAKHSQYKSQKQKSKKGSAEPVDEAKVLSQKAQAEKLERDRLLNQQRKEEAERKAIAAQIRQLIETNGVKDRDGDICYNFQDANVVKHLYVSEAVYKHIMAGLLAIAKVEDTYELVPVAVAEKIIQRDPQCIILCNASAEAEQSGDDPYADYKIPDDLMW